MKRLAFSLLLFGSMFAVALPVNAGGWASVRVVSQEIDPDNPESWTITVVVLQHDISPIDVGGVTARFTNSMNGATVDVIGVATGETGEYRIAVDFPEGGSWSWAATPEPYPATNMASLVVGGLADSAAGYLLQGTIWRGNCQNLESIVKSFPLVHSSGKDGAVIDVGIVPAYDLIVGQGVGESLAITVDGKVSGESIKKCRVLTILDAISPITIPVATPGDSASSESWTLLPGEEGGAATFITVQHPSTNFITVEITETGGGAFNPPSVTVPAGTTVTWVNKTTTAHTISGVDPTFASSGMLDPGQLFSQAFTVPGTYHYDCDPHSWMMGTVTVTGS